MTATPAAGARRLAAFLAASVAVHGLLGLIQGAPPAGARPGGPAAVRLTLAPTPTTTPTTAPTTGPARDAAEAPAREPPARAPRPAASAPAPAPTPVAAATAASPPPPARPRPARETVARAPATPSTPAARAAPEPEAAADTAAPAPAPRGAQLEARLRRALLPHFDYPALARRRGWQGVVRIALRVGPEGDLSRVRVVQTSGHALLDASALRTLRRVGRLPQAAPWLGGRPFDMVLPVRYRLVSG